MTSAHVTSSGESLFVEFVSDNRKERQGFAANYTFVAIAQPTAAPVVTARHIPSIVYPSKKIDAVEGIGLCFSCGQYCSSN